MSKHNYTLEPNVSFTPDQKMVIFRSNMFGPTYVFGVEIAQTVASRQVGLQRLTCRRRKSFATGSLGKAFSPWTTLSALIIAPANVVWVCSSPNRGSTAA